MTFSATSDLTITCRKSDWEAWDCNTPIIDDDSPIVISGVCAPQFFPQGSHGWCTVENTAEMILRCVFGSVCSETDEIRGVEGIYLDYAKTAVERLTDGEDTGLLHPDVYTMWDHLSEKDQHQVASMLYDAARKLEEFPDVSTMNIVDTQVVVEIDMNFSDVPSIIPAIVGTSAGSAGIIPSLRGYDHYDSALTHLSYPHSEQVPTIHVWDIPRMKITKATPELFLTKGGIIAEGIGQ